MTWKQSVATLARLWTEYRDARCDPVLIGYESGPANAPPLAAACRLRITQTAAADLRARYDLDDRGFGRADVETQATAARRSAEEEGPCAKVEPAECDYCAMTHCWEARLKADDRELNAAWRAALARIAAAPGLRPAQRADWTARLRTVQRLWLRWRDDNCELERLETPNPAGHSVYSLVTGPCLARETEARIAVLRRTYR